MPVYPMRTVATFRNPAFNTTDERPYFIGPGCFGDDLARWLITRLRANGTTTADHPGQEDFGWYFDFDVAEGPHTRLIALRPGMNWVIWAERRRGPFALLFGGRHRGISRAAVTAIHEALVAAPGVTDLRWHDRRDFDAGREDLAHSDRHE